MSLSVILRLISSREQVLLSLSTALVVGTVLNIINQWDAIFAAAAFNYWQMTLTYMVPYCVATYAGVKTRLN